MSLQFPFSKLEKSYVIITLTLTLTRSSTMSVSLPPTQSPRVNRPPVWSLLPQPENPPLRVSTVLTSYLALVYISVISFISSSCFSFFYPITTPYSQILGILRTLPSCLNLTPGTRHMVVYNRLFIHYILLRYIHAPKHILLGNAWYLK